MKNEIILVVLLLVASFGFAEAFECPKSGTIIDFNLTSNCWKEDCNICCKTDGGVTTCTLLACNVTLPEQPKPAPAYPSCVEAIKTCEPTNSKVQCFNSPSNFVTIACPPKGTYLDEEGNIIYPRPTGVMPATTEPPCTVYRGLENEGLPAKCVMFLGVLTTIVLISYVIYYGGDFIYNFGKRGLSKWHENQHKKVKK
jgi:hypothetical protein